ncbi:MAG: molybdopterin-binding protein, partial [Deltaproteobacteria bacterium]|nr:molybdopterin-binding protein [Deltaproteobacteria bacterium]
YTVEDNDPGPEWLHEDEAVLAFAEAMAGEGIEYALPPKEGKLDFTAAREGLLVFDKKVLTGFNLAPGVMCSARQNHTVVEKGRHVAGCRALPLYLARTDHAKAMAVLEQGPLFEVMAMRSARVGILVTGTEVFQGLIEDRFIPIIKSKVEKLGCRVVGSDIVPDERTKIVDALHRLRDAGSDLIVITAGLSVDPDDVTREALVDAGAEDLLFGAPILPGAMTLVGRIGGVQVFGVPACALFYQATSFDLLLPRLLAGLSVTRLDLAEMADGGYCLNCKSCTFPKCPFGK